MSYILQREICVRNRLDKNRNTMSYSVMHIVIMKMTSHACACANYSYIILAEVGGDPLGVASR